MVRAPGLLGILIAPALAAAAGPAAPGIEVRLLTAVSTYHSRPGDRIEAAISARACAQDGDAIPDGAVLRGEVGHLHKVGLGLIHESANLELRFDELAFPDGRTFPVAARVVAVDNARERVDRDGRIRGVRATGTVYNKIGQRIALESLENPYTLIPVFLLQAGVFSFPNPEIEYGPGAELYLAIDAPETIGGIAPCVMPDGGPSAADKAELRRIVDGVPYWSYSKRQPQPMDAVNLLYVGSREEVERAFAAAGWNSAVRNSVRAGLMAVRAVAQNGAYEDAPMRTLLLDGVQPVLSLQKSLNTFAKRDHLRIWERSESFQGRPVWASAATKDLGVTFSFKPFGFTHSIEKNIDLEREMVVGDLAFTGCVDSVVYVDRSPAGAVSGPGRKGIESDWRVAAVLLNSCRNPRIVGGESPLARPWLGVRVIRRVTLTLRNHFLRDNIFYRAGQGAWYGGKALRRWYQSEATEASAKAASNSAAGAAQ